MPLVQSCLCLLLLAVTVGVGSGADLGVQGLLLDLDFLALQLGFALCLGNLGIDGSRLNGALLLLLLDGVGGVGLGSLSILLHLQFRLLDRQIILLLGDVHVRLHLGIIGRLGSLGLGNGDIPLCLSLGDSSILLDLAHVVLTKRVDKAVFIGDTLDIAGDDLDAQRVHVGLGLGLHLVAELLTVIADLFQSDGADDLTHVALQGIHDSPVEVVLRHIQEVLHSQLDALRVRHDPHLGHGVHVHADEVLGGNVTLGLDVDGDLADDQLIHPLQEGDLDAGFTDEHLWVLPQAGDDVGHVGGCFHVAHQENENDQDHGNRNGNCLQ